MATLLNLNCWVLGDDSARVFTVEIDRDENVGSLKKAIKEKKKPAFDGIDADSLEVWKVSVPYNDSFKESVDKLSLSDPGGIPHGHQTDPNKETLQPLLPLKTLGKLFSEPPLEEHVHIIVRPPPRSTPEKDDVIVALQKRRNDAVKKGRNAKSPSESATTAPPIQLFHPVFGHFLDDLSSHLEVPQKLAKEIIDYMRAASALYDKEETQRQNLDPYLCRILGTTLRSVENKDRTRSDGVILVPLSDEIGESAATLFKEDKNEFGNGGCDPSTQAGLSVVRFWVQDEHEMVRNNTCCPTFLLATAGAWFTILGAVFTDKWIIQHLTDFIWAGPDATLNEPRCMRVICIMHSEEMLRGFGNITLP